jgi:hypothetical protein
VFCAAQAAAAMEAVADAAGAQQFVTWEIVGNVFQVPTYYTDVQAIGIGGFGLVWCVLAVASARRRALTPARNPARRGTHRRA